MNKLLRLNAMILAIAIAGLSQTANAVPAYPYPVDYMLPDSSTITIQLFGDEFVNWRETDDGYTLLFSEDGFLEYAEQDGDGDIKPSGVRARDERKRTAEEKKFLAKRSKKLRYSRSQIETMKELRRARNNVLESIAPQSAPISGSVRIPVILVGFQGKPFTKSKSAFEMLFNQLNYTAGGTITGSLRDYFLANSYGKMDLQIDVFGPYTLPNPIAYYDNDYTPSPGDPRLMARAAIDSMVNKGGANLSNYLNPDKPGYARPPHIIFAGYAQSSGAPQGQSIWPHAWNFTAVSYSGVKVDSYSCSAELRGNSGSNMDNIGTIAHEMGHALLGLPDFYDTDYAESGGTSVHLDKWDLMASGNNNNDGATPPYFSAYARATLGWVDVATLTSSTDITIPNPNTAANGIVYRLNNLWTENP